MPEITYFDLEVDPITQNLLDIGCVNSSHAVFHKKSLPEFFSFIAKSDFLCGHNIFRHDLAFLQKHLDDLEYGLSRAIDTLPLSALFFPNQPYHRLTKGDKLQSEERNNPVSDAKKSRELLMDEIAAFTELPEPFRKILFQLLHGETEFSNFFRFINYSAPGTPEKTEKEIRDLFKDRICGEADIRTLMQAPIPLAYTLVFIWNKEIFPAWLLKNYSRIQIVRFLLNGVPCGKGCTYCRKALDPITALQRFFGLEHFRKFGDIPLQEEAVQAAIQNQSLLTIFPTGGGKSITFQLPALMSGDNANALTVVISPLQSLMKDQVDGLEKKHHITDAVAISGLLSQIEKAEAIHQVEEGRACLLYIAPESLRSLSIEQLLLKREIARFVIDEAHCFSAWGQDFRVDYLYIGEFIRELENNKRCGKIPISCFTATAKQKVIEDIGQYFKEKLGLDLKLFRADTARANLHYRVWETKSDDEKYARLRELIEAKPCPVIVYVSRTKIADELARKLTGDGFPALAFHGKMDKDQKTMNQNEFMDGKVNIMVATSAFGMGVDKADVGMVIHYNISDSLENYIQEAGRAGRNELLSADCYILYDEEDLDRHFILHNQTKLSLKEIKQVWKAVKELTQIRNNASYSALEIARKAGWDENVRDTETRVTTTIAALEEVKYVRRGRNYPWVYANSILCNTAQEAFDRIETSEMFVADGQMENAKRIISRLFSSKSKRLSKEEKAESRVDYLADQLGLSKEEVIRIITLLKDLQILADTKDIRVFIKKGERSNQSLSDLDIFRKIEYELGKRLTEKEIVWHLKELNTALQNKEIPDCSVKKIRTIINFWTIKGWVNRRNHDHSGNNLQLNLAISRKEFEEKMDRRHYLSAFAILYLFQKSPVSSPDPSEGAFHSEGPRTSVEEGMYIEFSVLELKKEAELNDRLHGKKYSIDDVEEALFYLSRIDALRIDGGFMVIYNRLSIERVEKNSKQYTSADYRKLENYYLHKVHQIHIVGEYARKMILSEKEALAFSRDYFNMDFFRFLKKYFPGQRQAEISRTLTPAKFSKLFGRLSSRQLEIINDVIHRFVVVAAGPGSGKTKVLVHKLASLLLFEDVKPEQLLMLTFSRAAATEFKTRLLDLIGEMAHFVEIKTFHSYCFDLLGRVGNIDHSDKVVKETVKKIQDNDIEESKISKTVLVIDEAQDMDEAQFELVQVLIEQNEDMRVIMVGDDDQNIFAFRGASSAYMKHFMSMKETAVYELTENFRSGEKIVSFANQWAGRIVNRLKTTLGVSVMPEDTRVSLKAYSCPNLIVPVSAAVRKAGLSGTTGIMVRTNEEAIQMTAVLRHLGMKAKLIQDNERFPLSRLYELRAFSLLLGEVEGVPRISQSKWNAAIQQFSDLFRASALLDLVLTIAGQFEMAHPSDKYYSDWIAFIRESQLEDFANIEDSAIYVSTIHKVKGKQFDNVVVLLNGSQPSTDDEKRLLYVAITRAKTCLDIHYQGNYLERFASTVILHDYDEENYPEPEQLAFILTHKDVNLGHFKSVQTAIEELYSGDQLLICKEGLTNPAGHLIVKFSRRFIELLETREQQGYHPLRAHVNFIVYWMDKDANEESKIVLPELLLSK
ncbi:RecQ family ATP-dependent DNA helicase [Flavitalea flava]